MPFYELIDPFSHLLLHFFKGICDKDLFVFRHQFQ